MKEDVLKVLGFSARSKQFAVKTQSFSLTVEDGKELVSKRNSESQELALAALAGSLHSIGFLIGGTLKLELKSIQIEVQGYISDPNKTPTSLVDFRKIDVIVKPCSTASIVVLKEWIDAVKVACPVLSEFKTSTPTVITLVKDYEKINVA